MISIKDKFETQLNKALLVHFNPDILKINNKDQYVHVILVSQFFNELPIDKRIHLLYSVLWEKNMIHGAPLVVFEALSVADALLAFELFK
jgi:hypothetical protein